MMAARLLSFPRAKNIPGIIETKIFVLIAAHYLTFLKKSAALKAAMVPSATAVVT